MSSQCTSDGDSKVCSQTCDTTTTTCPGGFDCTASGTTMVCLPSGGPGGGGGGGCDSGGGGVPLLPILFGLGFAALVFTRRRA
jgi:hypothetical protein